MGDKCYWAKDSLRRIGFSLAALMLSGCGGIVYKDAATTYVVAGRAATKSINDAAATLAVAQDRLMATRIVADAKCPIAEQRIFLRDKEATHEFKAAIARIQMPITSDCQSLLECDSNSASQGCSSICYSAAEANCIAAIEKNAALRLNSLPAAQAEQFAKAMQSLSETLNRVEYGRAVPIQNVLIKANLEALTEYLDLLEKLATKRESDFADGAKKLSEKLTTAHTKLTELTGKQLSVADKTTQTQIASAITAMGKFSDDIKDIADNAHDAGAIRKLISERSSDVKSLIASIREVTVGDAMLGMVFNNLAQMKTRQDLQTRYEKAGDAYDRSLVLAERDKHAYMEGDKALASVNALFDAMTDSHDALVELVLNPSDKDRAAITNAKFQEFKIIAQDVSELGKLFF